MATDDIMRKSLPVCINSRAYDVSAHYPSEAGVNEREHGQQESSPVGQEDSLSLPSPCQRQHSIAIWAQRDKNPIALLNEQHFLLLQEMGGDGESIKLKDASFIHLLDTGGQPSFQDALPLLLDAPCTYIQVFNAARNLDQPVPITYHPDDHTEESLPPSAETGWEMMLRSFSSMQTMAHKCSKELASFQQEEGQLPQFRIFVVGTFKDRLMKEGRLEEAAQEISKRMKELEGKPYFHCIKKDSTRQSFYLINNMADKKDERVCVSSLREHLCTTRSSLKLKVPVMWYLCELITQRISQKFIN